MLLLLFSWACFFQAHLCHLRLKELFTKSLEDICFPFTGNWLFQCCIEMEAKGYNKPEERLVQAEKKDWFPEFLQGFSGYYRTDDRSYRGMTSPAQLGRGI